MRRLKNAFSRFIYGLCLEDQREEVREIERQRKWSIDPRPAKLDCWAVIYTLIVSTELIYRAFSIELDHAEEFKIVRFVNYYMITLHTFNTLLELSIS